MKKLLLTTLAASISATAVHAAPTLYGQIDVSINSIKDDAYANSVVKVESNASRFGVKGNDELSTKLKAVYQAEFGVSADGDATDLSQRDRFVGLKHADFGTLKIGKYDTYLKRSEGPIDLFNDQEGENLDMKKTLAGENRIGNVIGYESNKIEALGGVQFNILLQPGENAVKKDGTGTECDGGACDNNGIADGVSASIVLDRSKEGYYLALAADNKIESSFAATGDKARANIMRLSGSLSLPAMAGVKVGGLFQTAEPSDTLAAGKTDKETSYLLSASYSLNKEMTIGGQFQASKTDLVGGGDSKDINQFGAIFTYAYDSKTKTNLYYADRTNKGTGGAEDKHYKVAGVSLLHKF